MFPWSSLSASGSLGRRAQPIPVLRIGVVALRHGQIEVAWGLLRPGSGPQALRDVRLLAGGRTHVAEVVPDTLRQRPPTHGVFRLPLPEADLPWVLEGVGPEGPWREELDLDPLVLDDYRHAVPVGEADEHDGVWVVVERVAARSDRLTVFYTVAVDGVDIADAGRIGMKVLYRQGHRYPVQPPPTATWPPRGMIHAPAANFVGQPSGSEVEFEINGVTQEQRHDFDIRLPVPEQLPAVTQPDIELPTGHRMVEAVFTERGVILRFAPGPGAASLLLDPPVTAAGQVVQMLGGVGGEEESVAILGPLPPGAASLLFAGARTHRRRQGSWRVRFTAPMTL